MRSYRFDDAMMIESKATLKKSTNPILYLLQVYRKNIS
jgi:hypothetical protein